MNYTELSLMRLTVMKNISILSMCRNLVEAVQAGVVREMP